MPYYHVKIAIRNPDTMLKFYREELDLSVEDIKLFAEQYEKGTVFFKGEWIDTSNIEEVEIRETYNKSVNYYPKPLDSSTIFYGNRSDIPVVTRKFIKSPPIKGKMNELSTSLIKTATFLGLDNNWSLATCALQLQEVAVTLVAKRKNIKLDRMEVEKVLGKKIQSLSFNNQYGAFAKHVKESLNIGLPILTTHLRKMRTKVLHEGYNPKPEETESIVSFTIGLLKKLRNIS